MIAHCRNIYMHTYFIDDPLATCHPQGAVIPKFVSLLFISFDCDCDCDCDMIINVTVTVTVAKAS